MRVEPGGGVVVEVLQGGRGGQAGEPQPPGQAPGLGSVDLDGQEPFQGGGHGQVLGGCGVQDGGQVLGGVGQLQDRQVGPQLLVEAGLGAGRRGLRCGGWWSGHGWALSLVVTRGGVGGAGVRVLRPAAAAA